MKLRAKIVLPLQCIPKETRSISKVKKSTPSHHPFSIFSPK